MSKHTPGKWYIGSGDDFWAQDCFVQVNDPNLGVVVVADVVHAGAIEEAANLRLIAAAPELLAACEAALEFVNVLGEHSPVLFGDALPQIATVLQEAIAEAKGEEVPDGNKTEWRGLWCVNGCRLSEEEKDNPMRDDDGHPICDECWRDRRGDKFE